MVGGADQGSVTDTGDNASPLDASGVDAEPAPDAQAADAGCISVRVHGDAPPLAREDECGRLSYGRYANQGQSEAVHILPDFSFAGYMQGGVALPQVEVVVTLQPEAGDNRARIQAAIDQVAAGPIRADGSRGAVLLRAGRYEVSDTLIIGASAVVLRGEGQGVNGTVLVATRRAQHDLIRVQGEGSGLGVVSNSGGRISSPYVPVGATEFELEAGGASDLSVGDTVAVLRTPNETWIEDVGMAVYGWTPSSYTIGHERKVVGIAGDTVTIDIPIVDTLEARYGSGEVRRADLSGRIEQVGIENLRLESEFDAPDDEAHGWVGVRFRRTINSWVRRVSAVHFGFAAVSIDSESSFNTVEDCAMLDPVSQVAGTRRYSFNVGDGVGNLFQRLYSERARHDFVTGARVTGPNVWLDSYSTQSTNDDGPHHRWATGLLFDNTVSRELRVQNRADSGTGHGWAGAQTLFWNATAASIVCDAPHAAMNWAVGCVGPMDEGWVAAEPFGIWESHGRPVEPRSLYLAQLRDRLGQAAVEAVTLPQQRAGRIWDLLAGWQGEGRLEEATPASGGDPTCATGIPSGNVCCAASCGECGGSGCGSRPGGASNCCSGAIRSSGRLCATVGPPCVL